MINKFSFYHDRVDRALKNYILSTQTACELLRKSVLYAALNGGKRLRPLLIYAAGECFGRSYEALDIAAAAIECIHSYSLVHDDLPAMDDDSLRRGKATTHIAFGEASAILAGDALQALAFDLLSQPTPLLTPSIQLQLIQTLAHHAGAAGMVDGQSLDLLAEGKKISLAELEQIHRLKTGALIRASVKMGALAAGCEDLHTLNTLDAFASKIGLAFQLQDDVLDVIGNSKKLGKNTGQDEKLQKATYATLFGIEPTQHQIHHLMTEANALLESLPHNTTSLKKLSDYLLHRDA